MNNGKYPSSLYAPTLRYDPFCEAQPEVIPDMGEVYGDKEWEQKPSIKKTKYVCLPVKGKNMKIVNCIVPDFTNTKCININVFTNLLYTTCFS